MAKRPQTLTGKMRKALLLGWISRAEYAAWLRCEAEVVGKTFWLFDTMLWKGRPLKPEKQK